MIYQELEKIVNTGKEKGLQNAYITNSLKEYLQIYVLYFIYTSPTYMKNLIFTGGTCLRHFFGLERLSVDLDFDVIGKFDSEKLQKDIVSYFYKKYRYDKLVGVLKQNGEQILLKFPFLKQLGLAAKHETDLLYVKVDVSKIPSDNYVAETTSMTKYGFNFISRHYDLPSLMAGKIHAILRRQYLLGKENRKTVKGRDYFDLLWFVKKGVVPNITRLSDMLSDMLGEVVDLREVELQLDKKVEDFLKNHMGDFKSDIVPLIENPEMINTYVNNYKDEYLRYKALSFSSTIQLSVRCIDCGKIFSAGISISQKNFETMKTFDNTHTCPFCGHQNKTTKKDYIIPTSGQ